MALIGAVHLEDYAVLVAWPVDRRDLPLRECVVEGVVDVLHADAEARGGFAIDCHVGLQAALLAVGGDVDDAGQLLHALDYTRHPFLQLVDVRAPERELILRIALPAADAQVLRRKHENTDAGNLVEPGPQPRHHLLRADIVTLVQRLETDEQAPTVDGGVEWGGANRRTEAGDRRIGKHDIHRLALQLLHRLEGNVGRSLGAPEDQPGVVLREVALGNLDVEPDGQHDCRYEHDQHQDAMLQEKGERVIVESDQARQQALHPAVEPGGVAAGRPSHEIGTYHRRHRQRHHGGNGNSKRERY